MAAFHGPTAKRHILLGNCSQLVRAIEVKAGYLAKSVRESLPGGALVTKTINKYGKVQTTGIKDKLKASQILGGSFKSNIYIYIRFLYVLSFHSYG